MNERLKCYKHQITTGLMQCKKCETIFCTLCITPIVNRNYITIHETFTACPKCGSDEIIHLADDQPKK